MNSNSASLPLPEVKTSSKSNSSPEFARGLSHHFTVHFSQFIKTALVLVAICIGHISNAQIPDPPRPPRIINDFANILSSDELATLEQKARQYRDSTSTEIAVVTIKSLEGYDVGDFSNRLAQKWGIGNKEKDNGILLLVALDEHKIRIETGYGTEAMVPDAVAGRIIRETITPYFKNKDYYGGISAGLDALYERLNGSYKGKPEENSNVGDTKVGFLTILIIALVLFMFLRRIGGGGSTISGRRNRGCGSGLPLFLPIGGGGSSSWGGGGSSWGGGGGGSSFGGFGGGSFGGGGASGSW